MVTPAENKKPVDDNKVFDVTKPGKTAPSATARPLIVGHGTMIQDPMVNNQTETTDIPPAEEPKETKPEMNVEPSEEATKAAEKPAEEKPAEEVAVAEDSKTEEIKPPEKTEEDNADSGAVDELATQVAKKKQDAEDDVKSKSKQEELNKIIESKKYFIPIGQVSKRNNSRMAIIIVVVLALLIVAYLLVDAGVIDLDVKLPVDLIKN